MPHMWLIFNPASDRGNTIDKEQSLRQLIDVNQERRETPYELTWVKTQYSGHATELTQQGIEAGCDMIVAIGGDGTVHEVVNGLLAVDERQRPMLGVIPVGTGNDFAANVGLPENPEEAIEHLFAGCTRLVDAGLISDLNGRREYWHNTMGLGFSGAATYIARQKTKIRGFLVYLVSVIETILRGIHNNNNLTMTIDSDQVIAKSTSMIAINNGPREGGGFPTMPEAIMDDGLLSYAVLRKINRLQMLYFVPVVMAAQHLKYKSFVEHGNAQHLHIKSEDPLIVHADGELFCVWDDNVHELEIEILPAALTVLSNC